jgi:hypothetical protein
MKNSQVSKEIQTAKVVFFSASTFNPARGNLSAGADSQSVA